MLLKSVEIKKVLFAKEGFTVAVGLHEGKDFSLTTSYPLKKSIRYHMEGEYCFHKSYGKQFKVSRIEEDKNLSKKDIMEYLKTFDGIGPSRAKKIVDMFGENTLEVIKLDPHELSKVGIKQNIYNQIHEEFLKNDILNYLVSKLKPIGVSQNMINKIYDKYKNLSIDILNENPYELMETVSMPFDTADTIAMRMGISPNSNLRVKGCIKYSLNCSAERGHSYVKVKDLIKNTEEILKKRNSSVKGSGIIKCIINLEDYKKVYIEDDTSTYLPIYYYAEKNIARKLSVIAKQPKTKLNKPFDEIMSQVESEVGITYSENQKEAIRTSIENPISIITGGPGTGKTTTVNGLIKAIILNNPSVKLELAAPTGKAAKRMEESTNRPAKTIHRLLEYKPYGETLECGRNENNPLNADVLIIDESSMIDLMLMDKFIRALDEKKKLIIVGDVDQLASVGAGNVLADMIESNKIPCTRLDTIFRQAGTSTIVVNANLINHQKPIELGKDDFVFNEINGNDESIAKAIVSKYKELLLEGKSVDDIQVLSPLKRKTECGSSYLNKLLQEVVNPKTPLVKEVNFGFTTFRVGDKVMQTKNNYDKECFNGDVGKIKDIIYDTDNTVIVSFDDRDIEFIGREEILQLELAYACSVHKSQGSEYSEIIMPMVESHKRMLTKNLFYTGVTRAKKKVHLFGSKKAINHAISNKSAEIRNSKLIDKIKLAIAS